MPDPYYRKTDLELASWATNAGLRLESGYASFRVTLDQASAFVDRAQGFQSALSTWLEPTTRTPVSHALKTAARASLVDYAAFLMSTINVNPLTTDAQREELGIAARRRPSPLPMPTAAPIVTAVLSGPESVRLVAEDPTDAQRRAKPRGVASVVAMSFVGNAPPLDPSEWTLATVSTRTTIELSWPPVVGATTVWFTCCYVGTRGETGPMSQPASVRLPGRAAGPTAATATGETPMKIAA